MLPPALVSVPHSPRGSSDGEDPGGALAAIILGTYREMPGLTLHLNQAARFFGVETATCISALELLVSGGHLYRRADGQYARWPGDTR